MATIGFRFLAIMLLAGVSYAQTTPATPTPPAPPAAPAAPSVEEQEAPPSADEINDQEQDAREQAQEQAEEARKQAEEARKQAEEARQEALKASGEARQEALKEAAKARAEASKERRRALAEARKARAEALSGSYLGVVDPSDVTPEKAASLKLKEGRGVVIGTVDHDSPAGKAGMKEHDVILSLNGQKVDNVEMLRHAIRTTAPGKTVPVVVSRDGQQMTFNVQLQQRPQYARIEIPKFSMPPMPPIPPMPPDIDIPSFTVLQYSARNGAMVEDISQQLADFFGVKGGQGVLVRSVERGSAADAAGLKAGDVIVKAGGEPVTCSADWRRALREHKGSLPVAVVRDKREQSLTMKLPDKRTSNSSIGFDRDMQNVMIEVQKMKPEIDYQVRLAKVNLRQDIALYQKNFEQMRIEMNIAGEQIRKSVEINTTVTPEK